MKGFNQRVERMAPLRSGMDLQTEIVYGLFITRLGFFIGYVLVDICKMHSHKKFSTTLTKAVKLASKAPD